MREHFKKNIAGYTVAVTATVVMAAFRFAVANLLGNAAPFLPFVLAVMVAGWYGGLWPGLLASALSALCGVFFFSPPQYTLQIQQVSELVALLLFVCTGAAISWLCEAMHAARRQLSLRVSQEQRQKESAEAWKARYEAAVKASHCVLYDSDRQTGQAVYGGACESILGYTPGEINGDMSKWVALIHANDRQNFLKEVGRANSDRSPHHADYRMVRKDGRIVWMRDDGHFAVQDGETSRIIGFVRDITDQRRAEQDRSRLEERLTKLIDNTPLAVVEWDANFSTTRWAGQAEKIFGWDSHEVVGKRFDEFRFVFDEDMPQVENALQQLGDSANNCVISRNRNYRKSGEVICCEWYSSVLHDHDGNMIAVFSLVLDVTERERSAKSLQESEARFRQLADAMPQVVWIGNSCGSVSYYNSRVERFSGVVQEADHTWNGRPVLHPDDLERTNEAWSAAAQSRTPYQCEHRILMHDGSYRWHLSRGLAIVDLQEEVQWFGTATDIHDPKASQFALEESQERFRAFMDSSPAMAWAKDEFGRYVFLNRAYEQRFGVRLQDWLGKTDFDVWPEETARLFRQHDEKALQAAAPVEAVEEAIESDGSKSVWWSFKFAYSDGSGERYIGGIAYDVTEQKKDQSELKDLAGRLADADRRKDEFLATLAHELRNPLAPLRTGLQVMRLANGNAEAVEQARSMMERQLEQMVRLVDDLMDVSRISRGNIELRKQHVRLAEVVNNAVETSRPLIEQMGHQLTVTLPTQSVVIDADVTRLAQVFMNLLNNSAKYSDRHGHIWLTAERQGSDVVVSVRDTGIGIPADKLTSIFELFSQVDRSLEKSQGGLGIGLNIVKRLVEMHGGRIEARSEGTGHGSEFVVRLPVVVEDSVPPPADPDEPLKLKSSLRIQIVDDNMDGADSLAMMLKIMGNETRTAYDGQEGVELAEKFRPDVLLFDIGLPKLNGYEACRHIREQPWGKGIMLIAVTGWGRDEDRRRTHDAGFDHHMVKPVDPSTLMKLLASLSHAAKSSEAANWSR